MHIHHRLIGSSVAFTLTTLLPAQSYGPEELMARREQKLASAFLNKADWITDYDKALEAAAERGQLVFAYFTRSDIPSERCTALEEGPLSDPGFKELGKRAVLFTHINSRTPGEPHRRLLIEKGGAGYPAIMILDEEGTPLASSAGTEQTFEELRDIHDTAARWLALEERAESGDRTVAAELLITELKLNKVAFDEATARASSLRNLTPEQRDEISQRMVNLEFFWNLNSLGGGSPESVLQKLLAMKSIGHIPTGDAGRLFWLRVSEYARDRRDADLYEDSLNGMRKILGDNPRYARLLSEMEQTLRELRGGQR